jgi:nucleotide-binding universal stress UspA family protein
MSAIESWDAPVEVPGGVVVGHDGSPGADVALVWALDDAARRGCPLHVVRTWMLASAVDDVPGDRGTVPSMQECADATRALLERDVAAVLERRAGPRLQVATHVVHGAAGPALVAAAAAADLLVVGHRGRGRVEGLLLGSVAEFVLRHAKASVVVVRP